MEREEFTVLDWIGTVLAAAASFCVCLIPLMARSFADLYRQLTMRFPFPTRAALSPWFPIVVGVLLLALIAGGASPGRPLRVRRTVVVAGFVLSVVALGFFLFGLYMPLWQVADAVKSE